MERLLPSEISEAQERAHAVFDQMAVERTVTEMERDGVEITLFPNPFTVGEQIALMRRDERPV